MSADVGDALLGFRLGSGLVAHIKELLSWSPHLGKVNRKDTVAHQGRTGAAGLLAASVARKPTQATTLSPSGGLTILSNEIGQPEDRPRERERIERGSEHGHAAHALPCLRRERQCRCRAVHI